MQWLKAQKDFYLSEYTFAYACKGDHLETLKWLRSKGCPWDECTCIFAAAEGHLDVLKYLHENGCPWNEMTCEVAAFGDHLDVLKLSLIHISEPTRPY